MSVVAKPLINAKYAGSSLTTEYTCPTAKKTIIDKFTVNNTDGSTRTVSIHIVPSGDLATAANMIVNLLSLTTNLYQEVSEMKNQVLTAGDFISVVASVASKVVIRASGREVT